MPDPHRGTAAVLTGDLIGSTKVEPAALERAIDLLAETARELTGWAPPSPDPRFTRYRGDGWQMVVAEPGLALRAVLMLSASLRAADLGLATRAAIGIGAVESLGTASLADARGVAFEASGRGLDHMARVQRVLDVDDPVLLPARHFLQEDQAGPLAYAIADQVAPLG